jgi:hypothetical protein
MRTTAVARDSQDVREIFLTQGIEPRGGVLPNEFATLIKEASAQRKGTIEQLKIKLQ